MIMHCTTEAPGLKLVKIRDVRLEVIVIDQADRIPTANQGRYQLEEGRSAMSMTIAGIGIFLLSRCSPIF